MKKSKSGVVIYKGKWIDMYQFRNFRIANKLSNPSDVTPKNVKRFLTQRALDLLESYAELSGIVQSASQ